MTRVIGYARVSTEDQVRTGCSLDAQAARIGAYCTAHGYELVEVVTDAGISARTMKREGLEGILRRLKRREADGLVAVKLDRVSRSTQDVLTLVETAERQRWSLHSIEEHLDTSSPHGRFVVTVLAALAQLEREQAAERVRSAMAHLRRKGKKISGRPPFGFRFEGSDLVEVGEEQEVLGRIQDLAGAGHGATEIARRLGRHPRTGRRWRRQTVAKVLGTSARRMVG